MWRTFAARLLSNCLFTLASRHGLVFVARRSPRHALIPPTHSLPTCPIGRSFPKVPTMTRLLPLIGIISIVASATAQTVWAPQAAAVGDTSTSQNYFRETLSRWQSIYDTAIFTNQSIFSPVQINTIAFRPTVGQLGFATTYPNVEVYLSYAANNYATPTTAFATNRTVPFPTTPNYAGAVNLINVSGAGPVNQNDITINLTTPFIFDPSLGQDLLVEVFIAAVASPTMTLAQTPVRVVSNTPVAHLTRSVRFIGAAAATATAGTLTDFSPAIQFSYSIPPGVAKHDPYGAGCYLYARSFYEQFPGAFPASSNDLSNTTVTLTPNVIGGYNVLTLPGSTLVMPTGTGLALGDDVSSAAIPIPFTFDYPGGSTTSIYAHSNGSVTLNGAATGLFNAADNVSTLLASTVHVLAASMQDLLPDGVANTDNVFAEVDPTNPNVFLITWRNVPCFLTTPAPVPLKSTFQIALIDSGTNDTVEYRYLTLVNDSDSYGGAAITGFSTGGTALNPGNRDLTALVAFNTETDLGSLTLFGSPRPVLGVPVNYTLSNLRPNLGISTMLASFGQIPGGIGLPSLGVQAPGCNVYIDPISNVGFGPLMFGAPTAGFAHTWPLGPWSGVTVYVQGFELSLNENAAGVISSNGMKVELGTL